MKQIQSISRENTVPAAREISLCGLFDLKSLSAGSVRHLYPDTIPQGNMCLSVCSERPEIAAVSVEEDGSVRVSALAEGCTCVTVTAADPSGALEAVQSSFTVQVIAPKLQGTRRTETAFNEGWRFRLERDMSCVSDGVPAVDDSWETVTIPHCWNAEDGADGGGDYHRGAGWYLKTAVFSEKYSGKTVYLRFGAACKVSELYVDGHFVGRHEGGYSAFCFDITRYITPDRPVQIALRVDNRVNDLTPQSGDFTVFGGLYREVTVIAVDAVHLDPSDGSQGLYLSQRGVQGITKDTTVQEVFGEGGSLTVTARVKNSGSCLQTVRAFAAVYDADWNPAAEYAFDPVILAPGQTRPISRTLTVAQPHLWGGVCDPYLYNVVFELQDESDAVLDRARERFGFRFYCVDAQEGFFLNGRSYPLRGVSSHQDRQGMGYAVPHRCREQDMAMMAAIGANTIRFAHYQHDPFVYQLADERGITVWAEIPMVNSISNTHAFYESTLHNLYELLAQARNRTSIIVWGIHNEQWPDRAGICVLLDRLYKAAKQQDPSRYVAVASAQPAADLADGDNMGVALSWQSDVSAWNKYFGLYQQRDARYFSTWIQDVHAYGMRHKTITASALDRTDPDGNVQDIQVYVHGRVGMSEYGVGCNPAYHEEEPGYAVGAGPDAYQTEEFQAQWHEIYYKAIAQSPWLWGSYVWNMFEFGSDSRDEAGRRGINNKGMVSYDRTYKKDVFYFYQANWSRNPVLHLNSKTFAVRRQDTVRAKVYSNLARVELFVNGVSQEVLTPGCRNEPAVNTDGMPDDTLIRNTHLGKYEWSVTLRQGENTVTAVGWDADGKVYTDNAVWQRAVFDKPGLASERYTIREEDPVRRRILDVPGGTMVGELLQNLTPLYNCHIEALDSNGQSLADTAPVQWGMQIRAVAEDGATSWTYTVEDTPVCSCRPSKENTHMVQAELTQVCTVCRVEISWKGEPGQFTLQGSLDGQDFFPLPYALHPEDAVCEITHGIPLRRILLQAQTDVQQMDVYGFALESEEFEIDNTNCIIQNVECGTTAEALRACLCVYGSCDRIAILAPDRKAACGVLVPGTAVEVTAGTCSVQYTLALCGPEIEPIWAGKVSGGTVIDLGQEYQINGIELSASGCVSVCVCGTETPLQCGKNFAIGRYLRVSTGSSCHLAVYGFRFAGTGYCVNLHARCIRGIPEQITVRSCLRMLDIRGNYSAAFVLDNCVLEPQDPVTPGVRLRVTSLSGEVAVEYAVETTAVCTPLAQRKDACGCPGKVCLPFTDPHSTEDWYYLTGVVIKWQDGAHCAYRYTISAKNPVGIETGFAVDKSANTIPQAASEHWARGKMSQVKDLTLTVQGGAKGKKDAACTLTVYGWRICGRRAVVDELNACIRIGRENCTAGWLRSSLDVRGSCTVSVCTPDGRIMEPTEHLSSGCALCVEDCRGQRFEYNIIKEV